jgi:hypothetical protein
VTALRYAVLALAVAALTRPVLQAGPEGDFTWHMRSARRTWQQGHLETPHFLYPLLTIAVRWTKLVDWDEAAELVSAAFQELLAVVLMREVRRAMPATTPFAGAAAVALTLALLAVTPVTFASWPRHSVCFGYLGINTYHNPTMYLLRPLALLLWLPLTRALAPHGPPATRGEVATAAALGVLCALAKPSYGIALLPALVLAGAWQRARGRRVDLRLILLGFVVPTCAVLTWQFGFSFAAGADALAWAPLEVMARFPGTPARVALTVVFPAVVYLTRARRDPALNLAWLTFAVGAAYAYLLAETGNRIEHANLIWSGQISAFLFVASALFVLRQAGGAGAGLPRSPRARRLSRSTSCAGCTSCCIPPGSEVPALGRGSTSSGIPTCT